MIAGGNTQDELKQQEIQLREKLLEHKMRLEKLEGSSKSVKNRYSNFVIICHITSDLRFINVLLDDGNAPKK
jgi:hypothetical protein